MPVEAQKLVSGYDFNVVLATVLAQSQLSIQFVLRMFPVDFPHVFRVASRYFPRIVFQHLLISFPA